MGRKRRTLPYAALLGAVMLAGAARPERFRITLWSNNEADVRRPDVIWSGPHPCGAVVEVRTASMAPYPRGGSVEPELVVERAGASERLRWSVPVNYQLLAVRGPELLVRHGNDRLWISAAGAMRREPSRGPWPAPQPASCPADTALPNSEYSLCGTFRDLGDGAPRFIEYEAECS